MSFVKHPDPKVEAQFEAQRQRDLVEQQEIAAQRERLRVVNVVQEWHRTRGIRTFSDQGALLLDEIISTRFNGIVTLETLDKAHEFLVAQQRLRGAVKVWLESNSELNTPKNKAVGDSWTDQNPTATVQDFRAFVEAHKLDGSFEWVIAPEKLENLVRIAKGPQLTELKLQYGEKQVAQALANIAARIHKIAGRHNWSNEQEKEREESRRKQELSPQGQFFERLREQQAKNEAETIVATYRGGSHADSEYGRQTLEAIVVYRDDGETIDWRKTADARRAKLKELP